MRVAVSIGMRKLRASISGVQRLWDCARMRAVFICPAAIGVPNAGNAGPATNAESVPRKKRLFMQLNVGMLCAMRKRGNICKFPP